MPSEESFHIHVYSLAYSGYVCQGYIIWRSLESQKLGFFHFWELTFHSTLIYENNCISRLYIPTYYFGRTKEYVMQVITGHVCSIYATPGLSGFWVLMSFDGPDQILTIFCHLMSFDGPKNLMSFDGPKPRFSPFKISCLLMDPICRSYGYGTYEQ